MSAQSLEGNIIYESFDKKAYVYKLGEGSYEVRLNGPTRSKVIGKFDLPDEDSDTKTRAIELCNDWQNVLRILNKYQKKA